MPIDNTSDNSSKKSTVNTHTEQLDDSNTLHEQLKKIKEDSTETTKNNDDIDHPIQDYCS